MKEIAGPKAEGLDVSVVRETSQEELDAMQVTAKEYSGAKGKLSGNGR